MRRYIAQAVLQQYNQRIMNNSDKVRSVFSREGFTPSSNIRKPELQQLLNSLMLKEKNEPFDLEVFGEIWEQCSKGSSQVTVEQVCHTLVEAQNIVQNRLLEINEEIKYLKDELYNQTSNPHRSKSFKIEEDIDRLGQERIDYQSDLRFLTEPFGINPTTFMARAVASRRKSRVSNMDDPLEPNLDERGNEVQLKWLFILTLLFGAIEIIVIYKKYDFLNLIVFTCLSFIFLMNHFDRTYIKSILGLLILSEVIDSMWIFMNTSDFWSPPANGTSSGYEKGYLKLIILLTYLGVFLKIPLGVFLYHYRNVEENKSYDLDIGVLKFSLTSNKVNPITQGINSISIN